MIELFELFEKKKKHTKMIDKMIDNPRFKKKKHTKTVTFLITIHKTIHAGLTPARLSGCGPQHRIFYF